MGQNALHTVGAWGSAEPLLSQSRRTSVTDTTATAPKRRPLSPSEMSEIVETTDGSVRGMESDGIRIFRGIRYGASTAGDNRFRAPQPAPRWTGVLDTVDYGDTAPQAFSRLALGGTKGNRPAIGEDCLVLNVWTPGCDGARRPVLVWLHGGG